MLPRKSREQLRQALLPATIVHARENVVGYRELWGYVSLERLELRLLPIVTKTEMLEAPTKFIDASLDTAAVQRTGGTTGTHLTLYRSSGELAFIHDFFVAMQRDDDVHAPACICAIGSYHGQPTIIPYRGSVVAADFTKADHQDQLATLFSKDPSGQRDTIFIGLESQVRIVTCKLVEAGFDFSRSRVAAIVTTGHYVPGRLRRWFEQIWNVELASRYSLTEVFGGANRCSQCGYYHSDPHLIAEVVDPFDKANVSSGFGVLVLTCLYPFVQKQPMIRYFTGDLVRAADTNCPVDRMGFELKGRLQSSVVVPGANGPAVLLSGHDLYEILDGFPDVNSSTMFREVTGVADKSVLGHVKAEVKHGNDDGVQSVSVTVELRYAHYMYPDRTAVVLAEIREKILERSSSLREQVSAGRASLRLEPALPGALWSFQPDEVE